MDSHILSPTKVETFATYADHHELFDMFESMVKSVLVEMPQDPLQHMIDFLKKPVLPAVVICGPPRSGVDKIAERIAISQSAVRISVKSLLLSAMERQTSLGQQARPFMERGQMVPDQVIHNLITQRLQENDVVTNGFVMEGFPATKEQAVALQMSGVFLTSFVWIDCSDAEILDYTAQLLTDPVQKKDYHPKFNPPPKDPSVLERLVHRDYNSRDTVSKRLQYHKSHASSVAACFQKASVCKRLSYLDERGIWAREEEVVRDVIECLGGRAVTRAPRQFKVIVQGLAGSGKSSVAAAVEAKYGFVHVSPKKIILEEISLKTVASKTLVDFIHRPEEAPDDLMTDLILQRLLRSDCCNQGWVLEGFPNTPKQASSLKMKGIVPNRLIWLRVSPETCQTRLKDRRQDPLTGRLANLTCPSGDIDEDEIETWPLHDPVADKVEAVQERISKQSELKKMLEQIYGYRKKAVSKANAGAAVETEGIMQEVDAEGLGEKDAKGRHASFEKVLELVDDALMKPVPLHFD
ncbi:Adenylate kinase 8 [Podochytrium sp. JEL0797]|nr:Adenylate kinase 8 [Podochytrium sp. JEL0797]